jgi:stage V sporulation protein G
MSCVFVKKTSNKKVQLQQKGEKEMKITEVRLFPTESKDGKLKAFATMTFDDWFVVRNVKVIQGNNGLFVAMPSRKAMVSCPKCNFKNVVGSSYCNQCGGGLESVQPVASEGGEKDKHGNHMDIAHPITQECRVYIQDKILEAYNGAAPSGSTQGEASEKVAEETPQETPQEAPQEVAQEAPQQEQTESVEAEAEPVTGSEISETDESKDIEL